MSHTEMAEEERKRTIKLSCPSLSKVVQVVARDEQRLDLGSIARTFGLEPATLKLNGHFISRGVDLIASSVTWNSLISFFSSRGLSTGTNGADALVVHGKLCKPGSKRGHDSAVFGSGIASTSNQGNDSFSTAPPIDNINSIKKKRCNDSELDNGSEKIMESNAFCLKRKHHIEDVASTLKRVRRVDDETNSGSQRRENNQSGTLPNTQLPCSFKSVNMKRVREDEMVIPIPCKRSR